MALTFKRYTYAAGGAAHLPADWDNDFALGNNDWDEVCSAAGFDPSDEETGCATLETTWNGHPAGALVITSCTVEGHPFQVSNEPADGNVEDDELPSDCPHGMEAGNCQRCTQEDYEFAHGQISADSFGDDAAEAFRNARETPKAPAGREPAGAPNEGAET